MFCRCDSTTATTGNEVVPGAEKATFIFEELDAYTRQVIELHHPGVPVRQVILPPHGCDACMRLSSSADQDATNHEPSLQAPALVCSFGFN